MNAAPISMPSATPRTADALRRIRLLVSRRRRLLRGRLRSRLRRRLRLGSGLRFWLRLRRRLDAAERVLEVVEDEPDGRRRRSRRGDRQLALARDEDTSLAGRDLELRQHRIA